MHDYIWAALLGDRRLPNIAIARRVINISLFLIVTFYQKEPIYSIVRPAILFLFYAIALKEMQVEDINGKRD